MSSDNTKEEEVKETPSINEADIIALPTEEEHPMKRPFEQTLKIEWTPYELVQELVMRKQIVEKLKKEAEGILAQVLPHERHIAHIEKMMELPMVKAMVDAEDEYLASTAQPEEEETPVEETKE